MHYSGPTSKYLEKAIKLDDGKPINWDNYHYRELIDARFIKRLVLRTSRQVGKSIFNVMTCIKLAHIPMFRTIYMAPSQKQADEFSKLKLGKIFTVNSGMRRLLLSNKSPLAIVDDMRAISILNDVYIKTYTTGASLKIGYASDEAGVEKVRGGSADALIKDESQSMLLDLIDNVLDPMLDSSDYRMNVNTGTPIDPDDDLCKLFDTTSQHTAVVKCHHCNRYTTLLDLKQIGREGVLCYHCLKPIDIRTLKFVPMNPSSRILGMHFNKLMMPGIVFNPMKYSDLVDKVYAPNRNDNKLYAEELGVPKGYQASMLLETDVARCKNPNINYTPDDYDNVLRNLRLAPGSFLVAGIDWGGGAHDQSGADLPGKSHTAFVLMVMSMKDMDLNIRVIYHKLYPLPDVKKSIDDVIDKVKKLPPKTLVAPDFMGGSYANSTFFGIAAKSAGAGIQCLPVRFAQLISLIDHNQEQFRIDVDRNFIVAKFLKKKILDRRIEISSATASYEEIKDSFLSMKSLTSRWTPGVILWVLKSNRTNDIMMAIIAGWVAFCVQKKIYNDIML